MNPTKQLTLSRDKFKAKATREAKKARNLAKKVYRRDLKISALNKTVDELKEEVLKARDQQKAYLSPFGSAPIDLSDAAMTRILCVLMVLIGVISFSSCPRILRLLNPLGLLGPSSWVPHFTSIIHWTQRYGLAKLKQVKPLADPWVAIIDQSISIGVLKVLVILRVTLDHFNQKGGALSLKDCECIYVEVRDTWRGESVCQALNKAFGMAGKPSIILKDQGTDLAKGVDLWRDLVGKKFCGIIDDIGHYCANALKHEFGKLKSFQSLLTKARSATKKLK